MVPITAMPIEPPSCRPTLSTAEASPDSLGLTPEIATKLVETKTRPRPTASTTSGPSTEATYSAWAGRDESQNSPTAATRAPAAMGTPGPVRAIKRDGGRPPPTPPGAAARNQNQPCAG